MNHSTSPKHKKFPQRRAGRDSQLLKISGRVRSIALTEMGHVSCVLDTPAGRLRALSDAASVHLPELSVGSSVQVVLLHLRRETPEAIWHWQLLCCRSMATTQSTLTKEERSAA